ncbi:MAG: YjbH domain-containing protein, partial [Paracoccaceae bacterium]
ENRPSLNFYGATGLIDMPSGEAQPDALLSTTTAHFGPISRTTLSFQITPRMSASFRFLGIRKFDDVVPSIFDVYYDRSFDLRYQVLQESRYLPAVTIGFQDFVGTGILSGEYIAATKNLSPSLKVTGGLGWGRLGSYGEIGSPLGPREPIVIGNGGNFNFGQWFKGPAAPFGGVEWQVNDKLSFKAEYSSDAYVEEAGNRKTFERNSPFNFGLEYQAFDSLRLGAYYMYGSELGVVAHFTMNPKQRPMGGIVDSAPDPVKPRPSRASDPDAWSPEWVSQPGAGPLLIENINKRLEKEGIVVEALGFTGATAQIRIRNTRYDAEAQAIGRVARAMTHSMPASVEIFEIVPVVNGMPASKVTLHRSDIEALEFAPDAAAKMRARTLISAPGRPIEGLTYDPALYPKLTWSLGPYNRIRLFDQTAPFKMDVGLRFTGRYEISPGLVLTGAVTKKLAGNLDDPPPAILTGLQPVRSDIDIYDAKADPALESLTLTKYAYLGHDVFGRLSVGYLERMFGGISAEVLWKPIDRPWALGVEVNYVAQRDNDGQLGFSDYDYSVASGHLSAYYSFGPGYHAQLDVGRYLAGDVGATLALDREFTNGWKVGAFVTKTNVSSEDFGSGSFDKGIRLEIPFAWGTGAPTRKKANTILRPFGRDGGARLEVEGRLYESLRDYQSSGLDAQWGRFWK